MNSKLRWLAKKSKTTFSKVNPTKYPGQIYIYIYIGESREFIIHVFYKNIYNLLSIMLHITSWTLMLMLHIRQSVYLVLTNVLSTSFLMFHIIFNEINTTLYNSGKGRCTRYMWSNDMFVLWNRISTIFYEDRKYYLHIFPR